MPVTVSADGTNVAFDRSGSGPPVILVMGAFNDRSAGESLAHALESHLTVFNYDRRGRGASGDTLPYAVAREVEDIESLIREAGGSASLFGYSSGANLAINAAASGLNVARLALYDAPFIVDEHAPRPPADVAAQLAALISAGQRGEAVELFQTQLVGIPVDVVVQLRHAPFRPALEAVAHTLVYDATLLGDFRLPTRALQSIDAPTLVVFGGDGPPLFGTGARALADAVADGRQYALDGQTHDIVAAALAPVLIEFFTATVPLDRVWVPADA